MLSGSTAGASPHSTQRLERGANALRILVISQHWRQIGDPLMVLVDVGVSTSQNLVSMRQGPLQAAEARTKHGYIRAQRRLK